MNKDQYKEIANTLAFVLKESLDAKMRFTALETSLQNLEYPLFAAYAKEIENLRKNKAFETNVASIEGLLQKLLAE